MQRTYFTTVLCLLLTLGMAWLPNSFSTKANGSDPDSDAATANIDFEWELNGPFGGTVRSLVQNNANPRQFFLGTSDGQLYVSNDGTRNWTWIPTFNKSGNLIDNLVIDPRDPETVYLGMWALGEKRDGAIYKSTDSGKTWKNVFRDHSIRALTLAPTDPKMVVAGALDGVFVSTDAGKTWDRISPANHPELRNIESVAVDPRDTKSIYAGTWHLPWKTTDGGKSWFSTKGTETQILDDSDIFSIHIDRGNPDRVFSSACSGIYRSLDAGKNWTKFQGIPYSARRTHIIFQNPVHPDTIFAGTTEGLWRTTDAGTTWKLVTSKETVINAIEIHETTPDRVVIGTANSGVLVSENGGETFVPSNRGFVTRQVSSIVVDPMQPGRLLTSVLYNGAEGSVYLSNDNGQSWYPSSQGIGPKDVYSLTLNPGNASQVYAATSNGVFLSENGGTTWKRLEMKKVKLAPTPRPKSAASGKSKKASGGKKKSSTKNTASKQNASKKSKKSQSVPAKPKATVTDQAKTTTAPGNQFQDLDGHVMEIAVTGDGRNGLVAAAWEGLFRTYDATKGWEKLNVTGYSGRFFAVATTPHEPDTLLVGTSKGLYASRDQGKTWKQIEVDPDDNSFVQEIAINPRDPKMILVGTRHSLYMTRDGMQHWERLGRGIPYGEIASVRFNPRNPDEILVGDASHGGLYLSTDGARKFRRIDQKELPSHRVWAVAFDLFRENHFYAGSFSSGVIVGTSAASQSAGQP